jgi:hypothetical protein
MVKTFGTIKTSKKCNLHTGCKMNAMFKYRAFFFLSILMKIVDGQATDGWTNLTEFVENLPAVDVIYNPSKNILSSDEYVLNEPDRVNDYTQNVIFDPCRDYAFNCCSDTYGTPEFVQYNNDSTSANYGSPEARDAEKNVIDASQSRRIDDEIYMDETCTGPQTPSLLCVSARFARKPSSVHPSCWNYNDTINAFSSCRTDGDRKHTTPTCMEIGYMQTAYIVQCRGKYAHARNCGTYLEVHSPHDNSLLSQVQLPGGFQSGYRMTGLNMTYAGNSSRLLCYSSVSGGQYEVWWVHRTLSNRIVERVLPFRVLAPLCDFDATLNAYLPYYAVKGNVTGKNYINNAILELVDPLAGANIGSVVDHSTFLFARPAPKKMNGQANPTSADFSQTSSYPSNAEFLGNKYSYKFRP